MNFYVECTFFVCDFAKEVSQSVVQGIGYLMKRQGGLKAGGLKAGGLKAGVLKAGGLKVGELKAVGLKAGGLKVGELKAGGLKAGGLKAGGLKAGGLKDQCEFLCIYAGSPPNLENLLVEDGCAMGKTAGGSCWSC